MADRLVGRQRDDIRAAADELILTAARDALDSDDIAGFDTLIGRLPAVEGEQSRQLSPMDYYRILITLVMILGLIVIIFYALLSDESDNASQYVSLFSGLAGISIGWLFGSGSAAAVVDAARQTA